MRGCNVFQWGGNESAAGKMFLDSEADGRKPEEKGVMVLHKKVRVYYLYINIMKVGSHLELFFCFNYLGLVSFFSFFLSGKWRRLQRVFYIFLFELS